jgi:hypothetical protein
MTTKKKKPAPARTKAKTKSRPTPAAKAATKARKKSMTEKHEKSKSSRSAHASTFSTPETVALNMAMNDSTDSIVALVDASTTATVGSNLQIDTEYMAVTDASDLSNLQVTRAAGGSTAAAHDVGAPVTIGVELPEAPAVPDLPEGLSPNQMVSAVRGF